VVTTTVSARKSHSERCDLLLFDECQGAAAFQASEMVVGFPRARKFGFSASPIGRSDGADLVLEALFGGVIFDYTYVKAVDSGAVVPIEVHLTRIDGMPVAQKSKIALKRWGLWRNSHRNKIIADTVRTYGDDSQILIMVETIEHGMNLKKYLPEYTLIYSNCSKERYMEYLSEGYTTDPYLTDKQAMEMQEAFAKGELKKVISTMRWREGVDFPKLRALVRADGLSGSIPSTQIPGRLSRLDKDKTRGILIDFMDDFDPRLRACSNSRIRHYKKLGWRILR